MITGAVTTTKATDKKVADGKYVSAAAAASTMGTITNNGVVEWIGGTLPSALTGTVYADITSAKQLLAANDAFTSTQSTNEVRMTTEMILNTELMTIELPNIKAMTISNKLTFSLGKAESFKFAGLAKIDVVAGGSLYFTGGDTTSKNGFYAFAANTTSGCALTLASGTTMDLAAGTKLDLGASGSVTYTKANVNNLGFIVGTSQEGTGNWIGNAVNENPKP